MPTITGSHGKVMIGDNELAEITGWTFVARAANAAYASSSTGGFRRRVRGVRDGAGAIRFKLDPADPLSDQFDAGDGVTLLLHVDATHFYTVPALIDSVRIEVDIDQGAIVGGVAEFSTNGPWQNPGDD